jgi:hypothetical protein
MLIILPVVFVVMRRMLKQDAGFVVTEKKKTNRNTDYLPKTHLNGIAARLEHDFLKPFRH